MSPVTTSIDNPTPRIFVEVVDGVLTTLQIARTHLDPQRHDEVEPALRSVIDAALVRHRADVLADLEPDVPGPAMAEALEFLEAQLRPLEGLPDPAPLGTTAGSAADGHVRAVVGDGRLTTLEFPPDLLQPAGGRALEAAVVAAVNEALGAADAGIAKDLEAPDEPDWAALASRIRRLEREDLL